MSIQLLREQRDAKAKALKELANKADYNPTNDNAAFDAAVDELNALEDRIKRVEQANALTFEANESEAAAERVERLAHDRNKKDDPAYKAFVKWAKFGDKALTAEEGRVFRNDLSVGTTTAGGFTVQTAVADYILDALLYFGGMRDVATIMRTEQGNPLLIPASNGTTELGAIVLENAAAADLDPAFTQIALPVFMYSSLVVPVSHQLLVDSQADIEGFVINRLVQRIGRIQNNHFTTGTGTGQPTGIVTAATSGKVGATGQTTSVVYDDLVDLEHSVDIEYRRSPDAAFMMNDLALRNVKKIKDTAGLPIFARDVSGAGSPVQVNTLMGYPVVVNSSMAVMAANARSILFGAMKKYVVRDVMEVTLQRYDDSAYAKKAQVGFNAWMRSGGNLIDNGGAVKFYQNSAT